LRNSQLKFQNKKERQSQAIEVNLSYHKYLESLLEGSTEYAEVKDIISRYDTLSAANQELLDRARAAQEKTESDRVAFAIATEVFSIE
jgi:ribosomal protein RSM22 (predicted rRNA methylase)